MEKQSLGIIVQVRTGATRLPGKPLKKVLGKELIRYQLERLRRMTTAGQIIVATTTEPKDISIVNLCQEENILIYRGSEEDVLDRYYQAANQFQLNTIVRITGDCPLIDPAIADLVVQAYLNHFPKYDYVSNTLERSYPRGLDVEVFSFEALKKAWLEAKESVEREHVTPYIYEHPETFSLKNIAHSPNESIHRWTVDTEEDFKLIDLILSELYPKNRAFTMQDILNLLKKHPEWVAINAHIKQKPLRIDS